MLKLRRKNCLHIQREFISQSPAVANIEKYFFSYEMSPSFTSRKV